MKRFTKILLILVIVIVGVYFFLPNKPYIGRSNVHGNGLFAGKNYQKGDIIFEDLFPYYEKDKILFNPIQTKNFNKYILEEGKFINHCSLRKNTDIITNDYKTFPLVAIENIKKHDELTSDYDVIHKHYPFIAPSKPSYKRC